jgi:cell division initiation protein
LLTPRDLLRVQFEPALRGYNRAQVDEFIRRLIGEYEELVRENAKLKGGEAVPQPAQVSETAEQTLEQARQQAEVIVTAAREQATEEEARLAAIRQETMGFHRRMRTLLQEFSSLLDQGEAETSRLLQLIDETLGEAAVSSVD